MTTKCVAVVDNSYQRENLCQCCNILGVVPRIDGDRVHAETNDELLSEEVIKLFEQYPRRIIMVSDDNGLMFRG